MTTPDEPRKPGRPRKVEPAPDKPPAPPGRHMLEVRFNEKVLFRQPVHDKPDIDQSDPDKVTVTGTIRLNE